MPMSKLCVAGCLTMALTGGASVASGQQCVGQIGYWPLDGTAADLSGTGNHGTLIGSPVFVPGMAGLAMTLDGIDDSVFVPDHPTLNPTTAMSMSAWYFTAAFSGSGNDPIIDKAAPSHSPPYYQYHLGVSGSLYPSPSACGGTIALNTGNTGGGTEPRTLVDGRWYHLVLAFDGAISKFYLDGVLISEFPSSGTIQAYGTPLRFGRFNNLGFHLRGLIDEIRIFNRALSGDEAALLHDQPGARPMAVPASAQACAGSDVTLSVRMLQDPGATYQWRKDGVELDGQTGATLVLPGVRAADQGAYDCIVTGGCATATSTPAVLTICATDFNCDGETNPDDLGDFITCYFAEPACAGADFNADGNTDPDDLGDFITGYFGTGC